MKTTPKKSIESIADEIATRAVGRNPNCNTRREKCATAIVEALRARDERAAGICKQAALLASPDGVIPADDPEYERLQRLATVLNSAAAAIHSGKEG